MHRFVKNFYETMRIKDGFKGERYLVLPNAIIQSIEDNPLASVLYITDIGYYPNAKFHYRRRDVPIREYVLIYCIDGKGWYEVDGKKFNVEKNQYFILPKDVVHAYGSNNDDPWTIYWIHYSGKLAQYYFPSDPSPKTVSIDMASRINFRINLFEEIFNTLVASYSMENICFAMASFQYFLASLKYINQFRAADTTQVEDDTVSIVIHYFKENIERHLSLKDISDYIGLSPSRLSGLFKEKTGHSPLNYFNLLKITRACELLDKTEMKLHQIGPKIGIEDPYYFSRLFSKIMGMSPKAYRARLKS